MFTAKYLAESGVTPTSHRKLTDEDRAAVRDTVIRYLDAPGDLDPDRVQMSVAAMYDRKGYPQFGPLASELDNSPYRQAADEQVAIHIVIVSSTPNDYHDPQHDEDAVAFAALADGDREADRRAKVAAAARLRADAEAMLARAQELDPIEPGANS